MSDHLQTQCPHCHSVFRLNAEALAQADGQVRCGHCLAVFYAEVKPFEPEDSLDDEGIDSIRYETADDPLSDDSFSGTHDALQSAIQPDNFDEPPADHPHDDYAVADVIPAELRAESARNSGRGFLPGCLSAWPCCYVSPRWHCNTPGTTAPSW